MISVIRKELKVPALYFSLYNSKRRTDRFQSHFCGSPRWLSALGRINQGLMIGGMRLNNKKPHESSLRCCVLCATQPATTVMAGSCSISQSRLHRTRNPSAEQLMGARCKNGLALSELLLRVALNHGAITRDRERCKRVADEDSPGSHAQRLASQPPHDHRCSPSFPSALRR